MDSQRLIAGWRLHDGAGLRRFTCLRRFGRLCRSFCFLVINETHVWSFRWCPHAPRSTPSIRSNTALEENKNDLVVAGVAAVGGFRRCDRLTTLPKDLRPHWRPPSPPRAPRTRVLTNRCRRLLRRSHRRAVPELARRHHLARRRSTPVRRTNHQRLCVHDRRA